VAQPAEKRPVADPALDPGAVERAYRLQRARRRARARRTRERRYANLRFWLVLLALLVLSGYFTFAIWAEIQKLFGL
jgi:fatty acid desaturase